MNCPSSEMPWEYVVPIGNVGLRGCPSGTGGSFLMNCTSMNDGGIWSPKLLALSSLSLISGSGLPATCRLFSSSWSFCST